MSSNPTDTSERGLERLICKVLAGQPCDPSREGEMSDLQAGYGGVGWACGSRHDYDREYCVDLAQLSAFLKETQPAAAKSLALDDDGPVRRKFLARLQGQVGKRGTIDILRHGIKHDAHDITLFYATPSPGNEKARALFDANRFSITRQLGYSLDEKQLALDMGLFINGLPVATFELKNSLAKQTADDAVRQYMTDRNPREKLFEFGRCVAHFAVDEQEVRFCTHLKGKASWFLPFDKGWQDGAGNPPNPDGIKTDYLWREVLARESLANILENYAQVVKSRDEKTGRKKKAQIWPRYHQLDVVRKLLADAKTEGAGKRYLIQHSAGSGKSNSIAWLAHQLIGLSKADKPVFDSIIVITDRRILDKQIQDTIKQFAQVGATVGHAQNAGDLRKFIEAGKKIIISTLQKFPFILDEIGDAQRGRSFALIIDEAHSSQGGKAGAAVARALAEAGREEEEESFEDRINRLMESRKLLPNASYFAFTATPKNKTLELFGGPERQPDGAVKHRSFHTYTMKQAIQEGFILDVLRHYTPVKSYYKLARTIEADPEFDARKARKKLRRYVEGHEHAIRLKAEIMVDHFHRQVIGQGKIGGQARAMVVTGGVRRAIEYYHAIRACLMERKSRYRAIVAFSGEHDYNGARVSEASLNEFPAKQIEDKIREDPYRFLICADKFQTGYDEPLLHTMYVDKMLSGIKAVQTLSRLNRSHPKKHDTFVLDFMNDADGIREAFNPYYRGTILADETDPNKLHDMQADLDGYQVYSPQQIDDFVRRYLGGVQRDQLDPVLDQCVAVYLAELDEDGQIDFKGRAKAFTRTYEFLSALLPYTNPEWEKRTIFLNFLIPKLPAPKEEDLSRGILQAIDMDSYRAEMKARERIAPQDDDAEIDPIPTGGDMHKPETEMSPLTRIIQEFNDRFGNIPWKDEDRVRQFIEALPEKIKANSAYRNACLNSDKQNALIEHNNVLSKVMLEAFQDFADLYKQFSDNESFKRWLSERMFNLTYDEIARLTDTAPR